ncbi:MAG TPA: hypothetical protein VHZ95_06555, partial [Polyangiales bacterium]|nr:hypothetical protein [Polyangiales bacterium]
DANGAPVAGPFNDTTRTIRVAKDCKATTAPAPTTTAPSGSPAATTAVPTTAPTTPPPAQAPVH